LYQAILQKKERYMNIWTYFTYKYICLYIYLYIVLYEKFFTGYTLTKGVI